MKKVILVPRGPKQTTQFPLNGNKTIDMKALYKAFTLAENYKPYLLIDAEVVTKVDNGLVPFVSIDNKISVTQKGLCKIRSKVVFEDGTKKDILVEHSLNTSGTAVTGKDVRVILANFFRQIEVPVLAE